MMRTALAIALATSASALKAPSLPVQRTSTVSRSRVVAYQNGASDEGGNVNTDAMKGPFHEPEDPGYGLIGTLIRQGPVALFHRVADPNQYEMGVQKYQMITGCSRTEAQGNLDAAIADPNSWVLNKLHAQNGKRKDVNYAQANTSPEQIIKTCAWGIIISSIILKAVSGVPEYIAAHPHWEEYFTYMINGVPNIFP